MQIERRVVTRILDRLTQGPRLIQVMIGPRQVGKTPPPLPSESVGEGRFDLPPPICPSLLGRSGSRTSGTPRAGTQRPVPSC